MVIAGGLQAPTGLAVDDANVYVANRDAGTIVKCPRTGCAGAAPTVLAANQDAPLGLALEGTYLYWINGWRPGDGGGPGSRPVFRCSLPSCSASSVEPVDLGSIRPYGIAVTPERTYYAAWPDTGYCLAGGCANGGNLGGGPAVSVAVDASFSYFAVFGGTNVRRCGLDDCAAPTTLLDNVSAMSVAADATSIYIAVYDFFQLGRQQPDSRRPAAGLLRCPLAGCGAMAPAVLADDDVSPYAVAADGDRIYFTNVVQGTVVSILK